MRTVAEGVENEVVWQRLAQLGCDQAQGYHLMRPPPADELLPWLRMGSARSDFTPAADFATECPGFTAGMAAERVDRTPARPAAEPAKP